MQPTVVKKDEAKQHRLQRAKKRKSIKRPNATDERWQQKRKSKGKNAKASIDQATNNDGVDTAKSNGLDSINNIQPTVVKKDEAKQRLIKRRKLKAEIDQTPNATDEEKAAAKAKVDEAVTTAKNAIDRTNNAGVDTAKSNGLDSTISNQRLLRKTKQKQLSIKRRKLRKRKSTKHQTRQMKRRQQQKRKSMRQ